MKKSCNESYKKAGVDVDAGYESNRLIKPLIESTRIKGVLSHVNDFGGFFELTSKFNEPVLVSGTDGVGTKIKIAEILNDHTTIGIDCVAMCVNDVVCSGAKPLFFLDYLACGKNVPKKIEQIVSGVANGCKQANMALIGGETAEHPQIMLENEYDLAGFCVGVVEKSKILPSSSLKAGNVLIAMPSSGVHSNGFSLIRRIFDVDVVNFSSNFGVLNESLGEALLTPTFIYVKPVLNLLKSVEIKAICHITGGGFFENIPRILPKNLNALVFENRVQIPAIFDLISSYGKLSKREMFSTFNMGVGMICVVSELDVLKSIEILQGLGVNAYVLGELVEGQGKLEIV